MLVSAECAYSKRNDLFLQCMPPAYLSLHCLGGECGTILQGASHKCPVPCKTHTKCADCRRAQGCGWCAFGGANGHGVCMQGTRSGPLEDEHCDSKSESKRPGMNCFIVTVSVGRSEAIFCLAYFLQTTGWN